MDTPIAYRIEIRGEAGARVLRPFVDTFDIRRHDGRTTLVGDVTDVAHLHGLLVHLTSLNVEIVSINATTGPARSPS